MNGDERTQEIPPLKLGPAPEAIVLRIDDPVDALSIKAWIEHLRFKDREDLAEAAEKAASFVVRRRWPRFDTPLPHIPRDFIAKITGDR